MTPVPSQVGVNDSMKDVMRKFEKTNTNYMPVVDVSGVLIGYIARTRAYSMYRNMVADLSQE
jgi:CIC family chloride channel protein